MIKTIIISSHIAAICLLLAYALPAVGQIDTTEVRQRAVVFGSRQARLSKSTSLTAVSVSQDFLDTHFTGNIVQALEHVPGVQSMDIGSGFSKPMIRGLGFNRIAVAESGVKQEGQQWGADHGLEIDAFNVSTVNVLKGPASLIYGSDAMGGVIDIKQPKYPTENKVFGELSLLGKTVNGSLGGSLLLGFRKDAWLVQGRYTEQHFGDYRVPTDTVLYLTQKLPITHRRLKNTAGFERDASIFAGYKKGNYEGNLMVSNAFQKSGFFAGAHGVPNIASLIDDGKRYNIELPYSKVNHLKVQTHQEVKWSKFALFADLGWQHNHREEWSAFHTHYGTQAAPYRDPDKELMFNLHTLSANAALKWQTTETFSQTVGTGGQYQDNTIGGYGFLLPEYNRKTAGLFWLGEWKPSEKITLTGGLRYDWGHISAKPYDNVYLADYLREQGYTDDVVEENRWSSRRVSRSFSDVSGAMGLVWQPSPIHLLKINVGRSFRLPGANELAANGVHHGTFRHEQGDNNLSSEHGWQFDAEYSLSLGPILISASPFVSLFDNYIFLQPTGEWSLLPDAGQIYRYKEASATFIGGELSAKVNLWKNLRYEFSGEYVHTRNNDAKTALAFSPPTTLRNTLSWEEREFAISAELQTIARQNHIAQNEDKTPGATLLHLSANACLHILGTSAHISLKVHNVFDKKYYNHLSFYRKVEIPEPGRNFSLTVKIPFSITTK